MKADDSSLTEQEYRTVHATARTALSKGGAWGTLPTPVDDIVAAANLTVAPLGAFDEGVIHRYIRQAGEQAEKLLLRALDKVLGIFDVHADVIHIDQTVSEQKQSFLKLHETGHKELPHQRGIFRWIQDCRKHLAPEAAALFEREANMFASIVLFQDDAFAKMAADHEFGIRVPLGMAGKFGASVYAGMREYVRRHHVCCAVIVLDPTETIADKGPSAPVRRIEPSPSFREAFGTLQLPECITLASVYMRFVPFGKRRMSTPDTIVIDDRNGTPHEFVCEGFKTPFNTFILIHATATLSKTTVIVPAAASPKRLSIGVT